MGTRVDTGGPAWHDDFKRVASLLTVGELVERFGVTRDHVTRLLRTYQLTPYRHERNPEGRQLSGRINGRPCNEYGDYIDPDAMVEPEKLPQPTATPPGSVEKINEMRSRVERGEKLWHAQDADYSLVRDGEFDFGSITAVTGKRRHVYKN